MAKPILDRPAHNTDIKHHVGRPSRTAPGEVIWAFPASDVPWGER